MCERELTIVFVYNTELVKHESDDPALAVLYFCPSWISEDKKTNFCGQIIGTAHFIKSVFGPTKIISLQNGKFCLREFGTYTMAVGSDKDIPNWILENKTDLLSNLIKLFHIDFESMSTFYKDSQTFLEKLNQMFESFLKLLNLETLAYKTPDSNQTKILNIYSTQAQNFLTDCLKSKFILSGLVQWNNKLLATQMNSIITKCLLLTNQTVSESKLSAESIMTDFQTPKELQLVQIYLNREYYEEIMESIKPYKMNQFNNNNYSNCTNNHIDEVIAQWNSFESSTSSKSVQNNYMSYNLFKTGLITKRTSSLVDIPMQEDIPTSEFDSSCERLKKRRQSKSVCDPLYPFFHTTGIAVSKNLFDDYLSFKNGTYSGKTENFSRTGSDEGSNYYSLESSHFEDFKFLVKSSSSGEFYSPIRTLSTSDNLKSSQKTKSDTEKKSKTTEKHENPNHKECILFIYNRNNFFINFILDEESSNSSETINFLYECCSFFCDELSLQIENGCDESVFSETSSTSNNENYSYLFTNHDWEYVDRGGLKDNLRMDAITEMHQDLLNNKQITDIILRTDNDVIYGHQNENKVVYYQTAAKNYRGAPSPTDTMAKIFNKARRRLSRTSRSSSMNLM